MQRDLDSVRQLARERSPLGRDETERVIKVRFGRFPQRLAVAQRYWPLVDSRVLDVGCGYGTCLVHFGAGSVGVDNAVESVEFCRAIGCDARVADVEDEGWVTRVSEIGFDFVWVSDVLEHVDAPRVLLRRLEPALAPSGRLLVQASVLPRNRVARWCLRRIGERPFDAEAHYHQWTVETIGHVLARAGYQTRRVVVVLPTKLAAFQAVTPRSTASRVILEARPDPQLRAQAERAEMRNRRTERVAGRI